MKAVARHSQGLCEDCVDAGHLEALRNVSVIVGNQRHAFKRRLPHRDRGPRPRADTARTRAQGRAAGRAQRRLKNLFPEIYDLILAEERAAEGLEPFPLERAASTAAPDVRVWEQLVAKHRRMTHEADVDASNRN